MRSDRGDASARASWAIADRGRKPEAAATPGREMLVNDPGVRDHLSVEQVDAALDPAASRGSAGALVDRALQAHRSGEPV